MSSQPDHAEAVIAADLVQRIGSGDSQAEGALVARYRPRLLHVLSRMTTDFAFAEDVANEALLIAIKQLRGSPIETPSRLGGYLYGIAKNVMRSEQRKFSKEADTEPELLDLVATESPNQQQLVEQMDTRAVVQRVMKSVANERYREALLRYYLHQQDKDDVCAAMKMSRRDFTQVLSRARKSFRSVMEAEHE